MIRYLAGDDAIEVPSPTFTLVQGYDLPPFPLVHADLYRINDASELDEIGLSPWPEGVVALIEWPERAPGALPQDRIDIALNPDQPEGVWLRRYLEARHIPYFAFWQAAPGKATGAHIHIGPESTRLSATAD